MCNVSEHIRQLILDAAESHGMTGPYSEYLTEPRTDQAYSEMMMIREWINSLPREPKPNWSRAPKTHMWAHDKRFAGLPRYWTVDSLGRTTWHWIKPEVKGLLWISNGEMREKDGENQAVYVELELGIDWRTQIYERPIGDE